MGHTTEFTIGDLVRAERAKRRLTQEALASCVGVARVTIANIEAGRYEPSLATLRGIARALGCSISSLVPPIAA